MKKVVVLSCVACLASGLLAQSAGGGREAFLKQQAYAEMQRVTGQIDILQASHEELAERVSRMEGGSGELGAVKTDLASLRAEIKSVRREMNRMRQEIVADITKKVTAIVKSGAVTPASSMRTTSHAPSSCKIYTVQPGDTLSLIAQAFATSVAKLKELNGLSSDRLRIGQKLQVPKN